MSSNVAYMAQNIKVIHLLFEVHNSFLFSFFCSVKSVAQDQKNEIMSQLQTIRYLMKKRGMDCPPLNINGEQPQNAN